MADIWIGRLYTEVEFGHSLIVGGLLKPFPNRLSIDFAANCDHQSLFHPSDDIPLHLSVRFREKQIVRRSWDGKQWTDEEISSNLTWNTFKNPLQNDKSFLIRLTALQKHFEIYINEVLFCTYHHEGSSIKMIRVCHDFERVTQFMQRMLFPKQFPSVQSNPDVNLQSLSFCSDVPMPLAEGTSIELQGIAAGARDSRISFALMENQSDRIVVAYCPDFSRKVVVRNAQRDDNLFYQEDEECVGEFPFKRGHKFQLLITITRNSFQFLANEHHFSSFNFRTHDGHPQLVTLKCLVEDGASLTITKIEYNRKHK